MVAVRAFELALRLQLHQFCWGCFDSNMDVRYQMVLVLDAACLDGGGYWSTHLNFSALLTGLRGYGVAQVGLNAMIEAIASRGLIQEILQNLVEGLHVQAY